MTPAQPDYTNISQRIATETDTIMRAYAKSSFDLASPTGKNALRQKRNGLLHLIWQELWMQMAKRTRARSSEAVRNYYEEVYAGVERIGFQELDRYTNFFGRETLYQSQTGAHRLSSINAIARVLELVGAQTICEGGCGVGANLLYIGSVLPGVRLSGFDVSETAVNRLNDLLSDNSEMPLGIPSNLADVLGSKNRGAPDSPAIFQSSFDAIDMETNTVDALFTHAALEQCHAIYPAAFAEIRRVTRKHAIFFEPFADANSALERSYLRAKNYFRLPVADLEKNGFKVIEHLNVFPAKPTFSFSLVVCEVA